MGRERVVIEKVFCDVCGSDLKTVNSRRIEFGGERWELDVCSKDLKRISQTVAEWTRNGRQLQGRRRTAKQAVDEWEYLESLGFKRHRGRKSAAESAALANR